MHIATVFSNISTSTSFALLRTGVDISNLIFIQLQTPQKPTQSHHLLSNFALVDSRSIRNKILMLNDFVIEHSIDILAVTETSLRNDDFDAFYCRDIYPIGYKFYHHARTTAEGIGVALLVRK